jgi:hypothetical protein
MEIKKGIGVSPGVVIGTAVVLDAEDLVIPRRHVTAEQVTGEIQRFKDAVATAVVDLTKLRDAVAHQHGKEIGGIFDVHLAVLRDKSLMNQVISEIRGHGPGQGAPPPPQPAPVPDSGPLFKAGGSEDGPVPLMRGDACPKEFPNRRGNACYAAR